MKTQKRIGLISLAVAALALAACEAQDEPIPSNAFESDAVFWQGTVNAFDAIPEQGTGGVVEISANGHSDIAGFAQFRMTQSHVRFPSPHNDNVLISDGTFEIVGIGGQSIYGTYDGFGRDQTEGTNGELIFKVNGGTGDYESAAGFLTMRFGPAEGGMILRGEIFGRLHRGMPIEL